MALPTSKIVCWTNFSEVCQFQFEFIEMHSLQQHQSLSAFFGTRQQTFLKRLSMRPWWWSSGHRDFTQTISVRIPLKLYRFFCNIVVETSENEKRGRVGPFFKKAAFDIQLLYLFLKWDSGLWQLIKRLKHVKKKIAQKIIFDNCFF